MKSIYVCNWLPLLWIGLGILAYLTGIVGLIITKNMKGIDKDTGFNLREIVLRKNIWLN